jgi:transcriptional regulator with XRE-family HTH domain
MPARPKPPTIRLRCLAAALLRLRKAAELTREEVAERTHLNQATLYRIETARTRPQLRSLHALLELYEVDDAQRDELVALLRESGNRDWLQKYQDAELPEILTTFISFESEADLVWNYQSLFIPGLLQTEDYARAVIRGMLPGASRDEVENRVAARMERQALLTRDANPLKLWAVVDEAAVRRQVGGAAVMRAQLKYLREVVELPHITFQVIPFGSGAHAGMTGSFIILKYGHFGAPDVVYIDSMAGDLFLQDESDIQRYTMLFEYVRAEALGPDATASLIAG